MVCQAALNYASEFFDLPAMLHLLLLLEFLNGVRRHIWDDQQDLFLTNEYGMDDVQAAFMISVEGQLNTVFGILGSLVVDSVGIRKVALFALGLGTVSRFLLIISGPNFKLPLYVAMWGLSPFSDAVVTAGLYRVGLKKLTPPRMRPMAFAFAYQISNFAGAVALNMEDLFKNVYPSIMTVEDKMFMGKKFSGIRQLMVISWFIVVFAFGLVYFLLQNVTVIDPDDPEEEDETGLKLECPAEVQAEIDAYKAEIQAAGGKDALVAAAAQKAAATTPWGRWYARRTQRRKQYFMVPTPVRDSGVKGYFKGIAAASRFRSFWQVTAFYVSSFFVSKQWTFSSSVMTKFLERNYGEGLPIMGIVSINYIGCTFMPMIVAAFTGHRNPWQVMMVGLWTMAISPIFVIFGAGKEENAADGMMGCFVWQWVLTVGECLWSPRAYAWSASLAPVGYEGVFVALSSVKDLLLKPIGSMLAGFLNQWYNPNCVECRDDIGHFCGAEYALDASPAILDPRSGAYVDLSTLPDVEASVSTATGCSSDFGGIITKCNGPADGWPLLDESSQIKCPLSCRECPGWNEVSDPVGMWSFVLWWSIISPVAIWFFMPFIQGKGDRSSNFELFKYDIGRLQDCIYPGRGMDFPGTSAESKQQGSHSGLGSGTLTHDYTPSHDRGLPSKAGDVVTVLRTEPEWVHVRNADGNQGWIPEGFLKMDLVQELSLPPPIKTSSQAELGQGLVATAL